MSTRLRILVAVAAACLGSLSSAAAHAADPTPLAQAHPSTGLIKGQQVQLTWSGLPTGSLDVRECSRTATTLRQCEPTVRATGSGPDGQVTVPVSTGTVGPGLVCDKTHPCSLAIVPSGQSDLAGVVRAPLHFTTGTTCTTSADTLTGSGSPSADSAVRAALADACTDTPDAVAWTAVDDGRSAFTTGDSDLTVTERALTSLPKGTTVGYAPLTLSATVIAYDLHDVATGQPITDLRLSPAVLAQILTGQIRSWSDPAIAALNPGHALPSTLTPVVRSDGTWAATALSTWLTRVAPAGWTAGTTDVLAAPSDGEVADSAAALVTALGTEGTIGLLDSGAATGLSVATLVGAKGDVRPDASALTRSFTAMTTTSDGFRSPDWRVLDKGGWPLPDLAQIAVATSGPRATGPRAVALAGLLTHLGRQTTASLPQAARGFVGDLGQRVLALGGSLPELAGAAAHAAPASPLVEPQPAELPTLEIPSASATTAVEAPIIAPPATEEPSPSPAAVTEVAPSPAAVRLAIPPPRTTGGLPTTRWLIFLGTLFALSAVTWRLGLLRPRRAPEERPVLEVLPVTARDRWNALVADKAPIDRQVLTEDL